MSTFVIGHKNPDTDAICSAIAYADFLRRTSLPDAEAACCGEVSERTQFALDAAGLKAPKLLKEAKGVRLVLVDHNEWGQAVDGAQEAEIVEVLDHHRLGGLTTPNPIRFINEPVGSTCTLVARAFRQAGLTPEPAIALAMASGLISDTLLLTSPTTTQIDRETLEWLGEKAKTDLRKFAEGFFAAGSLLATKPAAEAIQTDCKDYEENGWKITVAQIEEQTLDLFWKRKEELANALETIRQNKKADFACVLVTDISRHESMMLVCGSPKLIGALQYPKKEEGLFELLGVVSRKKQLLPVLMEILAKVKK